MKNVKGSDQNQDYCINGIPFLNQFVDTCMYYCTDVRPVFIRLLISLIRTFKQFPNVIHVILGHSLGRGGRDNLQLNAYPKIHLMAVKGWKQITELFTPGIRVKFALHNDICLQVCKWHPQYGQLDYPCIWLVFWHLLNSINDLLLTKFVCMAP